LAEWTEASPTSSDNPLASIILNIDMSHTQK